MDSNISVLTLQYIDLDKYLPTLVSLDDMAIQNTRTSGSQEAHVFPDTTVWKPCPPIPPEHAMSLSEVRIAATTVRTPPDMEFGVGLLDVLQRRLHRHRKVVMLFKILTYREFPRAKHIIRASNSPPIECDV